MQKDKINVGKQLETWVDPETNLEWMIEDLGQMSWNAMLSYAKNLKSGWRFPTRKELFTLVSDENNDSYLKNNCPLKFHKAKYWTITALKHNSLNAWCVDVIRGYVQNSNKTYNNYIRCVRKKIAEIETWIDPETGLVWEKRGSKKEMSWEEAFKYAEKLGNGWRLPTIQELFSLIDFSRNNPACKIIDSHPSYYWSSTADVSGTSYAWSVGFYYGDVGYDVKIGNYYVRCIKGEK